MAIHPPGKRDRRNKKMLKGPKRMVAFLSLTAMVDMFTVLVIFLLQNYNQTGEVIPIRKDVELPRASAVKDLKPAHVVTVTNTQILLDQEIVADFTDVKEQSDWMISSLHNRLIEAIKAKEVERKGELKTIVRGVVSDSKKGAPQEEETDFRNVTVQADKAIDFLTIKKVMYTVTEAGASEINFAVMKEPEEKPEESLF
ncbi:MAG: adventurous gliding motility protein S [Bdellovibrionales bacterium CG10_big_fil_rev_8_21_14_0_10_45_34]|nr:MAG: adventurous gliding motility protein S [Bdellovibrionales bacterium CG10_big_fil_rev_8_21_14_0_10_45_34]